MWLSSGHRQPCNLWGECWEPDVGRCKHDLNVGCYVWHTCISVALCQHNNSLALCQCHRLPQVAVIWRNCWGCEADPISSGIKICEGLENHDRYCSIALCLAIWHSFSFRLQILDTLFPDLKKVRK